MENADKLNSAIIYDRDYGYNYFGFKTLEKSYLMRIEGINEIILKKFCYQKCTNTFFFVTL